MACDGCRASRAVEQLEQDGDYAASLVDCLPVVKPTVSCRPFSDFPKARRLSLFDVLSWTPWCASLEPFACARFHTRNELAVLRSLVLFQLMLTGIERAQRARLAGAGGVFEK